MTRLRACIGNIALLALSTLLCFLVLEFMVFRFVLVASDMPKITFVDGLVEYAPNQAGIFRRKNEIAARYQINADGWNSAHAKYEHAKPPGKRRIAIIGDSYVEALHVDYDKSFSDRLEQRLGDGVQVYRFGISGAPLSQYLQILRRAASTYAPDVVVILLVHNDFDESYQTVAGVYASSFLKIAIENGRVTGEVPPKEYVRPTYGFLRESATWRYLAYRQGIQFSVLRDLILRKRPQEQFQANVDVLSLQKKEKDIAVATQYLFGAIKAETDRIGARLMLVMDGDRQNIYTAVRDTIGKVDALMLNRIAKETAERQGIEFVDLEPLFEKDFQTHRKLFNSNVDAHWNEYGHEFVADVLAGRLK